MNNGRIDKWDLLISDKGFDCDYISKEMLENHQEEILLLKKEIGIIDLVFCLYLFNDDFHGQMEVVEHILPFCGEKSMEVMLQTHNKGSAIIKSSASYKELKMIQETLEKEKYKTAIRRVE